jgi:SnoaL-like domain
MKKSVKIFASSLTIAALAFAGSALQPLVSAQNAGMTTTTLLTQVEAENVINTLFVSVDQKDWKVTRSVFTPQISIDFTSLGGGKATIPADDLVAAWNRNLYKDKQSLHMTSNKQFNITANRIEARLHGYAYNKLNSATGSDVWETWGYYNIGLDRTAAGWKISKLEYFAQRNQGNERARDFVPAN